MGFLSKVINIMRLRTSVETNTVYGVAALFWEMFHGGDCRKVEAEKRKDNPEKKYAQLIGTMERFSLFIENDCYNTAANKHVTQR